MRRCVPTNAPPSARASTFYRHSSTCRGLRAEDSVSPSKNRISRLKRQASEQGAVGQPYSEFSEVEQVLDGWQKERSTSDRPEQDGISSPVIDTSVVHPSRTELQRKKEVEEALNLVNAAMKAAEGQLDDIPNLPSARLKRKVATRS